MKNKITPFIVASMVVVIGLCAGLPFFIAKIGDHVTDGKVYTAEIKTVQFIQELNDLERLYLLGQGMSVEIPKERANLMEADMQEVVRTAIDPYISSGVMRSDMENFEITTCRVDRYYSNEIPNLSGNFWKITMECVDDPGQHVSLHLDDQTGRIMLISYESLEPIFDQVKLSHFAYELLNLYDEINIIDFGVDDMTGVNSKKNSHWTIRMFMVDNAYGEIDLIITVTTTGFSIYLESPEVNYAGVGLDAALD